MRRKQSHEFDFDIKKVILVKTSFFKIINNIPLGIENEEDESMMNVELLV